VKNANGKTTAKYHRKYKEDAKVNDEKPLRGSGSAEFQFQAKLKTF
jgi:hypothetical protein